jgi:hypothetical protein
MLLSDVLGRSARPPLLVLSFGAWRAGTGSQTSGVRGGHVYGKSGRDGSDPSENPVTPHDVVATVYSLLGVPPETELRDNLGRPIRVGGPGQVIRGVIA